MDGRRNSPDTSLDGPPNLVGYSFSVTNRYRLWTMHILKRLFGRVDGPLLHGMLAGSAIMVISSLGLFYLWHSAREAQLDAVRTELVQLARVAATLADAGRPPFPRPQRQAGSPDPRAPLA